LYHLYKIKFAFIGNPRKKCACRTIIGASLAAFRLTLYTVFV
jgi:hypothetical protein